MKQYSFIDESQILLDESRLKNVIAGGLALLGTIGAGSAKLPQAYVKLHPGETNVAKAVLAKLKEPPKHKVNFTKEFTRGFTAARDKFMPANIKRAKEIGDKLRKSVSTNNFSDSFRNSFDLGKGGL